MIMSGRVDVGSAQRVLAELRSGGPMTRRQMEQVTGYSRPTLSRTLAALISDGAVDEFDDPSGPSGRGRPSRLLRLNPRRAAGIGLEIARGHVAVAVADAAGVVIASGHRSVRPSAGLTARTRAAIRLTDEVIDGHRIDLVDLQSVVAGIPGPQPTTPVTGRTGQAATSVRTLLGERFDVQVIIGNNTRLTAMAQARRYAARDVGDVIFVRLDEGVGGGFVLDGSLATGRGAAGEFGHICVDPSGPDCSCGGRGCLETIAGIPALLAATGLDSFDQLSTATDRRTRSVITAAAKATGRALAGSASVLHPHAILLGGRVATLPGFLAQAAQMITELAPSWVRTGLMIEIAEEDRIAGALGALAVAMDAAGG